MENFENYLASIEKEAHRSRMREILTWVQDTFPMLTPKIAWNQPMFTHHGTFIIGFSAAKQHVSISPEAKSMGIFSKEIAQSGYSRGSNLFRIKWEGRVNFALLERIIRYNMAYKKDCATFWRK